MTGDVDPFVGREKKQQGQEVGAMLQMPQNMTSRS